jgi:hypothetical protein
VERIALQAGQLEPSWRDVLEAIALFLGFPAACFACYVLREWRRLRREREELLLDAEASAAEGFPPPGPPTTDSLSPSGGTVQGPPNEDPDQTCI